MSQNTLPSSSPDVIFECSLKTMSAHSTEAQKSQLKPISRFFTKNLSLKIWRQLSGEIKFDLVQEIPSFQWMDASLGGL